MTRSKYKIILILVLAIILTLFLILSLTFLRQTVEMKKRAQINLELNGPAKVGDTVNISVNIDTRGYRINAAEVYLQFDPTALEVKTVEKTGSFFQLWITGEPKFSNHTGTISFAGGLPTPGFQGKGKVGAIKVKLLKPVKTAITFTNQSRMLLDDNQGTVTPLQMNPITVTIK